MRTLLTRRAGQPGTKKLLTEYGENLVCVRYRYDEDRGERLKTVEIVVGRAEWLPRARAAAGPVCFRIAEGEDLLRRAVLHAGGRWEEGAGIWTLPRAAAQALGLSERLIRRPRRRQR